MYGPWLSRSYQRSPQRFVAREIFVGIVIPGDGDENGFSMARWLGWHGTDGTFVTRMFSHMTYQSISI